MIEGVEVLSLKVIPDERGRLCEILRCDSPFFRKFGQVYMTTAYPGVVKAWHAHDRQTDLFAAVAGMFRVGLFDPRTDSPTLGQTQEIIMGVHRPVLVKIPRRVLHGFKCISEQEGIMVNVPDLPFNHAEPDERRRPWNDPEIPFDWDRKNG